MRKITIYLGTSILKSLLSEGRLSQPTYQLIKGCKGEDAQFIAYYSLLSLYELMGEYTLEEIRKVIHILTDHSVKLLIHSMPRGVDALAINIKYRESFHFNNEYELYNLAYYAGTTIESYITWDLIHTAKFEVKDSLARDYLASGYHAFRYVMIDNPQYLLKPGSTYYEVKPEDIKAFSEEKPIRIAEKPEYLYEHIQKWGLAFIKHQELNVLTETLPNRTVQPQRVERENVPGSEVRVTITDYKEKIQAREIPLLRFHADTVGFDMDYYLFEVHFTEGKSMIKQTLDDINFHRPEKEETLLSKEEYQALKRAQLFNKILPPIREKIKGPRPEPEYEALTPEDIHEVLISHVDSSLVNSFVNIYNLYEVKREAIDLMELLVSYNQENYRAFYIAKEWTLLHNYGGSVDFRNSVFILDRTGEKMFVILISCFID